MDRENSDAIRNVAFVAHSGAGKTSLTEAMAYVTGQSSRLGRVEEGNTISDFDPDEVDRSMSINLAVVPCEWRDTTINAIDTPGYPDFVGDVVSGLRTRRSSWSTAPPALRSAPKSCGASSNGRIDLGSWSSTGWIART